MGIKACGLGINSYTDFHQIFRVCLPQEDLELISFLGVSGKNCCHGNTRFREDYDVPQPKPMQIFTKFQDMFYPKRI